LVDGRRLELAAITREFLRTVTTPERVVDVHDTKLKGFVRRLRPSGVHAYTVVFGRGRLPAGSS